jgi:modification methylase
VKNTNHTVIFDDSRFALQNIEDKSIQLVVTSPPYWNIKNYNDPDQIGHGQNYKEYIASLTDVWEESKRILSPGCKLVINVGDQFLRAKENDGKYEVVSIHTDIISSCKKLGFTFLGNIIWEKITTTKTTGGCTWMGSIYYPRDGHITYEHEYVMIFKKSGKTPVPDKETKEMSKLPKDVRSKWFRGIWRDIPPVKQNGHVAMFPLELPERIIRMFTFAGETVLDPFLGSGTVLEAANKWNRNSIGIEINTGYLDMIKKRVDTIKIIEPWARGEMGYMLWEGITHGEWARRE